MTIETVYEECMIHMYDVLEYSMKCELIKNP